MSRFDFFCGTCFGLRVEIVFSLNFLSQNSKAFKYAWAQAKKDKKGHLSEMFCVGIAATTKLVEIKWP